MRLLRIILPLFFMISTTFAAENHAHIETNDTKITGPAAPKYPGYCQIEIVNNSYDNVRVYGVFDDGSVLSSFPVYAYGSPQYISLYYYGYCHAGMNILIDTFWGTRIYSSYTSTYSTIYITPYLAKQPQVSVGTK